MTGTEYQQIIRQYFPPQAKPAKYAKLLLGGDVVSETTFIFPKKGNMALFRQMRQLSKFDRDIEVKGKRQKITNENVFRVSFTIHSQKWIDHHNIQKVIDEIDVDQLAVELEGIDI